MNVPRFWYKKTALAYLLWPLAALFCGLSRLRRLYYQWQAPQTKCPVIIVGNISVGGTGKTPMVIWLSLWLQQKGYRPGIISRGYGSALKHYPARVYADSDPAFYGDEPVLIAKHCACPLVIAPKRTQAAELLAGECDILISDDGLQHYALARSVEIALIDGMRGLGNGFCLPAGFLREAPSRLDQVDFCLHKGELMQALPCRSYGFNYHFLALQALSANNAQLDKNQVIHAVAGLANPEHFFQTLRAQGWQIIPHVFPDHHRYKATDLEFSPVIMTEKDAVKCQAIAPANSWYLPIQAHPEQAFRQALAQRLTQLKL